MSPERPMRSYPKSISSMTLAAVAAGVLAVPKDAAAHSGRRADTTAEMTRPATVGELADDRYIFTWIDGDQLTASAAATIDFYYTATNPPTYAPGSMPEQLGGKSIAIGVPVQDTENSFVWDTSEIPAGSYWIWSIVHDPDIKVGARPMISFSPGVVTIAHEGDELTPAIVLSKPDNPFRWPDTYTLDIGYETFDPTDTGTVLIEAMRRGDDLASPMLVVAKDLPTSPDGHFEWNTTGLEEGDWILRATVADHDGRRFSAFDRYFRFVNHPEDAPAMEEGCTSVSTRSGPPSVVDLLSLMLVGLAGWVRATYSRRCRAERTGRR